MGRLWAWLPLLCLAAAVGLLWRFRRQLGPLGVAGVIMVVAGFGSYAFHAFAGRPSGAGLTTGEMAEDVLMLAGAMLTSVGAARRRSDGAGSVGSDGRGQAPGRTH